MHAHNINVCEEFDNIYNIYEESKVWRQFEAMGTLDAVDTVHTIQCNYMDDN
jgi:hypothetical protein